MDEYAKGQMKEGTSFQQSTSSKWMNGCVDRCVDRRMGEWVC